MLFMGVGQAWRCRCYILHTAAREVKQHLNARRLPLSAAERKRTEAKFPVQGRLDGCRNINTQSCKTSPQLNWCTFINVLYFKQQMITSVLASGFYLIFRLLMPPLRRIYPSTIAQINQECNAIREEFGSEMVTRIWPTAGAKLGGHGEFDIAWSCSVRSSHLFCSLKQKALPSFCYSFLTRYHLFRSLFHHVSTSKLPIPHCRLFSSFPYFVFSSFIEQLHSCSFLDSFRSANHLLGFEMVAYEDVGFKTIDKITLRGRLFPAKDRGPGLVMSPGVSLKCHRLQSLDSTVPTSPPMSSREEEYLLSACIGRSIRDLRCAIFGDMCKTFLANATRLLAPNVVQRHKRNDWPSYHRRGLPSGGNHGPDLWPSRSRAKRRVPSQRHQSLPRGRWHIWRPDISLFAPISRSAAGCRALGHVPRRSGRHGCGSTGPTCTFRYRSLSCHRVQARHDKAPHRAGQGGQGPRVAHQGQRALLRANADDEGREPGGL